MKKFNVRVVETLAKTIEVQAETIEEAEDIVRDMYDNEEVVLTYEDYDNEVEFYPTYVNPTDIFYIISTGWDKDKAEYIHEMFIALKEAGVKYSDEEIFEIVNESESQEFIGIYDESYFDEYLNEIAKCSFDDIEQGTYNPNNGFYKTKDGKYVMEVQY